MWNLTTAGLAAAASELGRPVREMGGTARDAAKAGAAHALAVTDTIDAFRQSPPLPTKPVARRTTRPAPQRVLPVRPRGLGHLRLGEAQRMQWLGEVAGLQESLRHIAIKKLQAERLRAQAGHGKAGVEALG
ncbi:hypothetical protein [Streptomyces sp. NPDC005969]|uniref:hypothetical protein n=1 Tax=Streptomyces sp. NPDC005969 TaxID=3156722 RepID=UPI0033C9CC8F